MTRQRVIDRLKANVQEIANELGMSQDEVDPRVVDLFFSIDEHLTAGEMTERLSDEEYAEPVHLAQVARTLKVLESFGLAERVVLDNDVTYWQQRLLEQHHDHLICVKCGKIENVYSPEIEKHQNDLAARHGFTILYHRHEIHGLCADCRATRPVASMPLNMVYPGEWVTVSGLDAGEKATTRLEAMGIKPGASLHVLQKPGANQMIVQVLNARFALGQGLAAKVRVVPMADHGSSDG